MFDRPPYCRGEKNCVGSFLEFVVLAQYPFHVGQWHAEFMNGLIPTNPPALLRRILLLLFCLVATRAYNTTDANEQSGRITLAIVLGIVLPRWTELMSVLFVSRSILVAAIVIVLWLGLVLQRRAMVRRGPARRPLRTSRDTPTK